MKPEEVLGWGLIGVLGFVAYKIFASPWRESGGSGTFDTVTPWNMPQGSITNPGPTGASIGGITAGDISDYLVKGKPLPTPKLGPSAADTLKSLMPTGSQTSWSASDTGAWIGQSIPTGMKPLPMAAQLASIAPFSGGSASIGGKSLVSSNTSSGSKSQVTVGATGYNFGKDLKSSNPAVVANAQAMIKKLNKASR